MAIITDAIATHPDGVVCGTCSSRTRGPPACKDRSERRRPTNDAPLTRAVAVLAAYTLLLTKLSNPGVNRHINLHNAPKTHGGAEIRHSADAVVCALRRSSRVAATEGGPPPRRKSCTR
jgi:hypothetical protein